MEWAPSPSPTVWRKRIEHDGPPEAGRVTSVVRYDPGSRFHGHPHPDGEEILVLDGVFSDERGDHPKGTYLLNPEGYEHAPFSDAGCVLFVKLRQYPGPARTQHRIDTTTGWTAHDIGGVQVRPLYVDRGYPERMHLLRFDPGTDAGPRDLDEDEEIFVVSGAFEDESGCHEAGTWVRYAGGASHHPRSGQGCVLYVKTSGVG